MSRFSLRVILLFIACLPLVACATHDTSVLLVASETAGMTTASLSSNDSFAVMSLDNNVDPCPRFTDSMRAAEQKLFDKERNYPHML